jgi:hypothetical protein
MFVYARTYVLLLNEKYVMHMYVCSLCWRAKLMENKDREQRQTENKERERERDDIKHRGSYHTFFLLKGAVWKKQDHSSQSSI